jgi:hypothetical protein
MGPESTLGLPTQVGKFVHHNRTITIPHMKRRVRGEEQEIRIPYTIRRVKNITFNADETQIERAQLVARARGTTLNAQVVGAVCGAGEI